MCNITPGKALMSLKNRSMKGEEGKMIMKLVSFHSSLFEISAWSVHSVCENVLLLICLVNSDYDKGC